MNHKQNIFAVASLMSCVSWCLAADSIDLKVTGSIIPISCTPTIIGGDTVDYGSIPANSLTNEVIGNALALKTVVLSIQCGSPIRLAISAHDKRPPVINTQTGEAQYGFAEVKGKKIGSYLLSFYPKTITGDSMPSGVLESTDATTWAILPGNALMKPTAYYTLATGAAPSAYKTHNFTIDINPRLLRASDLPLTQEIKLDGLTTFEIKYL